MTKGIAYQNKDIEFKLLSESFKERSFEAYGLKLPKIKAVLPTNLPRVAANEMRMDALFLLEDDTLAVVDFESENKRKNRIKYINYIGRVMERYLKDNHNIPDIRLIVIYTGDVERAEAVFQTKCLTLRMEQVFVRRLQVQKIYRTVVNKLANGKRLSEQELMQMILLPLAEKGHENKQKRVRQVIGLAKRIKDEDAQKLILSGLLVVSDKFISRENAEIIRREISMTKVGRMLYEEGMEKGMEKGMERGMEKGMEKGMERGMKKGMEKGIKEGQRRTAEKLLRKHMDIEIILDATDLTEKEIREIQDSLYASV